ncbi:unnamed protein product [Symbiodinium natans]|uniref:Uncharacterized protein n=1 Tax=Symbiodinium natans TaxID=878477 RepID=A0A812JIQ5_9DINO|nr:unnamed protein product [Symbiodinium natans]
MGVANIWRRNDLAVRSGGNGLCEIIVPHVKGELEVRMCVTGANLSVERGSLIPMARMQMEDVRRLLAEVETAKSEQIRLEGAVTQCSKDLKHKHQKLIDQIEKELEEFEICGVLQGITRIPVCVYEAPDLQQLQNHAAELAAPAKAALPLTVLSAGRSQLDQRCLLMNPRHATGLRSVFADWLRALTDDGAVSIRALWGATADVNCALRPLSLPGRGNPDTADLQEVVKAAENLVSGVGVASFVAIGLELCRATAGGAFASSALWLDLGCDELLGEGRGVAAVKDALRGVRAIAPQPLLQLLQPALCGDRVLRVAVCGPPEDPVTVAAAEFARLLATAPPAKPMRSLEVAALREGFAQEEGTPALLGDILAGVFQEHRGFLYPALPELLSGEVRVDEFGFPSHALPSLKQFLNRFQVTDNDRSKLHHAAEAEIAEFQANGWLSSHDSTCEGLAGPAPRWAPLADVFRLPDEVLTTSHVRAFARSQDQFDPLVRTISRLREDVGVAVALLPLCATHPFNVVRLLRLGGIHSLLALLADCSALAPGHVDAGSGDEALSSAEISTLVLLVMSGFAPIRRFLASQCIFELLAVALRHPATDRQLLVFAALATRLGRDTHERRAAAAALSPALAEQMSLRFDRGDSLSIPLQALAATAASLSPFLPVEAFAPLLPPLLAPLSASAPGAFVALVASLALSARKGRDLDLDQMVPRLLSLAPLEPPQASTFQSGAAALLALCSHSAAITSLCRPWVFSTASALLRSALRAGAGGLGAVRAAIPLAAAVQPGEDDISPSSDWQWEVEENLCMQRTFRGTWRSRAFSMSSTAGSGAFFADYANREAAASPQPTMRCQRLHGLAQLFRLSHLPESPNSALFQERPQLRIEVGDDRMELFVSVSLLPVSRCQTPCYAVDESAPGALGLWICELPATSEARKRSHQLDLRPPVHVSASSAGCKEHLVSVALPRGLYTLIPFSSHVVLDQQGVQRAKFGCRGQCCGCVDSNLMQESLWELGSRFACISTWAEATDLAIYEADPWYQRLHIEWSLLMQSLPIWLCAGAVEGSMEVLICVTGPEEDQASLLGAEPCVDLWPPIPHRRVRNERTGAVRLHIPALSAGQTLRVSCLWQEPIDPARFSGRSAQLLVYSSGPLAASLPTEPSATSSPLGLCSPPREIQGFWQASALFAGLWTQGFSSGFGSLRNPQVVLEISRSPGRGEELQLELYLCIPAVAIPKKSKDVQRPKVAITVFVRQEESSRKDTAGAPERLAEGVLRKELKTDKATVGAYAVASLALCGAESRQQLFVVLQNNDPQESWPWQLRVLARIRAKEGETPMGEATIPPAPEPPDAPPLRGAVLGGITEPGRIYTCWPEALALYAPKRIRTTAAAAAPPPDGDNSQGLPSPDPSHSWMLAKHDWAEEQPKVLTSCGTVASDRRFIEPGPWPERDPAVVPEVDEEAFPDVTATLAPPARVAIVKDEGPVRSQALTEAREVKPDAAEARRRPPVPLPPKRLHVRSQKDKEETETTAPEPEDFLQARDQDGPLETATPFRRPGPDPFMPASQSERHARIEALMRRRRYGRERIMEDPQFYREGPRQQTNSLPPPRVRRPRMMRSDDLEEERPDDVSRSTRAPPLSARGERSPSLPPIGEPRSKAATRHLVRLERQPGRDRLGFGNVAAGTPQAPVLVISWIRDGALADFNHTAPEGLAVPVNSAIVSVNGVSGDVQRMREGLRSQVVEMEVMAPERWRYSKVTNSA